MAATVQAVKALLGLTPSDTQDDESLSSAVAAVNSLVSVYRPDLVEPWPAHIQQGAVLYAARQYRRRSSTEGLAGYQELGTIVQPALDPDFERLLELGRYQGSAFA